MSPQVGFLLQDQVVPRLRSAIPQAVSFIGSEDAQELIQDATALAAQMIHNAEQAGKKVVRNPGAGCRGARKVRIISAGNVAFFTIQKLKCGRRSTGSSTVDVYGSGTQINGKSRLESMEQVVASNEENGGEIYLLHDVLASNQEDPATKAARRMDWSEFLSGQSKRDVALIDCLVKGKPLASLARRRHLNTSTILYHKRRLGDAVLEHFGKDIIPQVLRKPNWKDSLHATKERLAVRYERAH